ncbi:MAG: hypothetical protein QGF00_03280 [Planctomycetota bacterium]|jgi:hypothetical protein|nr:hypothetical protein [Planctomycetota bacterium]MDP7248600.1 hypothetical protein [Planctomycetota bacterium]
MWRRKTIAGLSLFLIWACPFAQAEEDPNGGWTLERIRVIEDLDVPECVAVDSATGNVFISSIVAPEKKYWADDGKGFISMAAPGGKMKKLRWLDSAPEAVIHSPKGMCILGGTLYFTDNDKLKRCSIAKAGAIEKVNLPKTKKLNDLATDGTSVWVSDTVLGKVYKVSPDGGVKEIPAPAGANGVTCHKGRVFAVSVTVVDLYELDPAGKKPPQPFGLASHFSRLDGIEVLDDGTFIVSDLPAKKVFSVSPDRKTVRTLAELDSPADIGLDRKRNLLYVPQFFKNQAVVFKLVNK